MTFDATALVPDRIKTLTKYDVPQPDGIDVDLDANESPFILDDATQMALAKHLASVSLNRYPDSEQLALRAYFCEQTKCAPEQLSFGNGSDEIIGLLMATFCGAGGRVAFPTPTFGYYRIAAIMLGVEPCPVPLDADFAVDWQAFDEAVSQQNVSLAFFALPNNPTGTLWNANDVTEFARRHPNTVIVADEAYFEYAKVTLLHELDRLPNLVIMRTVSKVGMAALRVGLCIASRAIISQVEKVRPPYNIGSLNQAAAVWLLTHCKHELEQSVASSIQARDQLAVELAKIPSVRVFPSAANFLMFRYGTAGDGTASKLWQKLVDHGVLVRNFDKPNTPLAGCLRVTVGTSDENARFLKGVRS